MTSTWWVNVRNTHAHLYRIISTSVPVSCLQIQVHFTRQYSWYHCWATITNVYELCFVIPSSTRQGTLFRCLSTTSTFTVVETRPVCHAQWYSDIVVVWSEWNHLFVSYEWNRFYNLHAKQQQQDIFQYAPKLFTRFALYVLLGARFQPM